MNKEEEKLKIEADPDYIYCPSSENSLEKFLVKHPDGVNDDKAAQVLMIVPDKLRELYGEAVEMIRKEMIVDPEDEE